MNQFTAVQIPKPCNFCKTLRTHLSPDPAVCAPTHDWLASECLAATSWLCPWDWRNFVLFFLAWAVKFGSTRKDTYRHSRLHQYDIKARSKKTPDQISKHIIRRNTRKPSRPTRAGGPATSHALCLQPPTTKLWNPLLWAARVHLVCFHTRELVVLCCL